MVSIIVSSRAIAILISNSLITPDSVRPLYKNHCVYALIAISDRCFSCAQMRRLVTLVDSTI